MDPDPIIESYVSDVVRRLPRRQRRDVGFELRSLLGEELTGRAAERGQPPDEPMALDLLASFGRPQDVADRYRPAGFTVIRPADAPRFAWIALGGVALQWAITLPTVFIPTAGINEPVTAAAAAAAGGGADEWLTRLSAWWLSWGLGSFWWPGLLISLTLIAALIRHHTTTTTAQAVNPDLGAGTDTSAQADAYASVDRESGTDFIAGVGSAFVRRSVLDPDRINRPGLVLALGLWALGASILIALPWLSALAPGLPQPLLDAFALDPGFLAWRAPWLLVLWAASFAHEFAVLIAGRTTSTTRRISIAISACWLALLTWYLAAGPTFEEPTTDGVVRICLIGIMAIIVVDLITTIRRETAPTRAPIA